MSMHSDDEPDSPSSHRPTSAPAHKPDFTFDDAFSDTDDDLPYEFSPAAIREELEKNLSSHLSAETNWPTDHELADIAGRIGFTDDADASVSTFDIDGRYDDRLSPPTQQPASPESRTTSHPSESESLDELALSTEFSSVNLESPHPDRDTGEDKYEQYEEEEPEHVELPAVQIETSEERADSAVVRETTPPPPRSDRSYTPSTPPHNEVDLPVTPQSVTSFSSTASLPMTASTSLPTPSSAQSTASSSSTFAAKHRASRSVGPSMLDKVVSKTRPSFLPPKSRAEDKKHMADWETMMRRSRLAGESGKGLLSVSYIIDNQFSFLLRSAICCLCYCGLSMPFCVDLQRRNGGKPCKRDASLERNALKNRLHIGRERSFQIGAWCTKNLR